MGKLVKIKGVTIQIGDRDIDMTIDEARRVWAVLDDLFGDAARGWHPYPVPPQPFELPRITCNEGILYYHKEDK